MKMNIRIAAALALTGVVAGGGYGLWYVFLRPSGPAAVGASVLPLPSSAGSSAVGSIAAGDISGTWTVDTSIGSFSDFSDSFVGYRVQEQLASIGGNTAVGRTPNVSGTVTIEGTTLTAAEISADLSTLQSDDDRRDGQLRRQGLQTDEFPTATFSLTEPIVLPADAATGSQVQLTATGDLTLHGQTKSVGIPLTARLESGVTTLTGSLEIAFADYAMEPPSSFAVLSVDDHGTLELQLFLTRS